MIQNSCRDEPTKQDYSFNTLEEVLNGENPKARPKDKLIVQNQKLLPACTMYSATHLVNWNNLLEDIQLWLNREQVDPLTRWNIFCQERWYSDKWSSIQTVANWNKKNWFISGYTTIEKTLSNDIQVEKMKKAIDMWLFMSCGSAYWNYTKIKKTWIYEDRTDWKFVWHAWSIVWYEKDYFRCINSYWPTRWIHKWYFKLPFSIVSKVYSKLVFIDKSDHDLMQAIKEKELIKQWLAKFREVYGTTNNKEYKTYLENIKLWENLGKIYWTTF